MVWVLHLILQTTMIKRTCKIKRIYKIITKRYGFYKPFIWITALAYSVNMNSYGLYIDMPKK